MFKPSLYVIAVLASMISTAMTIWPTFGASSLPVFAGNWCDPKGEIKSPEIQIATEGIGKSQIAFAEAGICDVKNLRRPEYEATDDHRIASAFCQSEASKWQMDIELFVTHSAELKRRILYISPRKFDFTWPDRLLIECRP